MLQILCKR